ncbi:MAG: iron ABC transporter permease [Candidatus Hydrogenedentes bacterium]|nr:iron ABC transporter permease [Candidatus Hydrogenedentota bacterium]
MKPPPRWLYRFGVLCVYGLCAAPLLAMALPLLLSPFDSTRDLFDLLSSGRLWTLWARTCGTALVTALVATAIGAPLGLLLDQPGFRERAWLRLLLTTPLLLPPHVLAVAWVDLLGQQGIVNGLFARWSLPPHPFPLYSAAGVALVQALSLYPIPLWCLWNAARQIDPALPEAARNLGARPFARLGLLFPLVLPALLSGALLVFVLSLLSFSIPSLLQTPVFTVEIFTSFNSFLDQRQASLSAVPLCLTGVAALYLAMRFNRTGPPASAPRQIRRNCFHTQAAVWGWAPAVLVVLLAIGLPLAALASRCMPPATLLAAWHTGAGEIGTSLLVATVGATLMIALALPLAWATPTHRGRLILLPCAMAWLASGPVFGVGLIQVWNHPGPLGWVYDHFPILLLAAVGRNMLFAWLGCRLAVTWLPGEATEASRNLGASPRYTFHAVVLPQLRRPLLAIWACLAILIMGEVETSVLVAPPGWVPVSLRIFTLMHYGPAASVSALALLQALATAGLLAVAGFYAGGADFTRPTKAGIIVRVETKFV